MAGIQISGLLSNEAFDWKSVVDQLMEVEAIPIKRLEAEKSANDAKILALADVRTALGDLQDSLQSIRANSTFLERAVTSSDANTSWRSTSSAGAPVGSYKFEVDRIATATQLKGGANIGQRLNATSADLSGLTMNALPTASAVKAGTFTVNGQTITFAATDSLKSVLDQITTKTGDVTWSYDETTDAITLTRGTGNVVLGAANDTSNFLQVMKLSNSGTGTVTSSGSLGTASANATLANARLNTSITAVDGDGNGTFSINGVEISYNVNSDTISSVLRRINESSANVSATFDAVSDRVVLANKTTGSVGITVSEAAGGVLAALNLTETSTVPAATTLGQDARFRVNDGDWVTSNSNTLEAAAHGITGLSITVNTANTQTLTVQSDTGVMQEAITDFIDKFNAVQDLIDASTEVKTSGTKVETGILYGNREIQEWSRRLRSMAFNELSSVTGSINALDDLGIDFDGTTGRLAIKDAGKLNKALANSPDDVQGYFSANGEGLVPEMYDLLTSLMTDDGKQQDSIRTASLKIDEQIATLQARLEQQRELLTNSFMRMLEAQSTADSQNKALTNAFFKDNDN